MGTRHSERHPKWSAVYRAAAGAFIACVSVTPTGEHSDPREHVTALRGERILRRSDGRSWTHTLEPIVRDTVGLPTDVPLGLDELEWLIEIALAELARHPLPKTAIDLGPEERAELEPIAFASFIVAHRAERLLQLIELGAGALDNLEHGSLQLAAIAARCLFETAAASYHVHSTLTTAWGEVNGSREGVQAIAGRADSDLWKALWTARLGTRSPSADRGWPKAINVQTRLDHLGRGDKDFQVTVGNIYDLLCEATHPNVEAHAVFWRVAEPDRRGRHMIRFDPARSHSPVKLAVVDAVRIGHKVIVPYCRDLWRAAAETACVCRFGREEDTLSLGLPQPGGRNDPCCCGSGIKTNACNHPEPPLPSDEIAARTMTP